MPQITSTTPPAAPPPRILFDEAHGQDRWFGVAPTANSGFSRIATLAKKQFEVAFLPSGARFSTELLDDYRALILAIGPQGLTQLGDDEIDAVREFVRAGGGLLVLGVYTGDWHHEANLNHLLEGYGMAFNRDVVMPAGTRPEDGWAQGGERSPKSRCAIDATPATSPANLLAGAPNIRTLSSCSMYVDEDVATVLLQSAVDSIQLEPVPLGIGIRIQKYTERGQGPVMVAATAKNVKVVAAGSWKMFLDAFIDDPQLGNRRLFENILAWFAAATASTAVPAAAVIPASPETVDEANSRRQALQERLRLRRALLAEMEKEAVLAMGREKAVLNVQIDDLKKSILADESEIDALHGG